VGYFETHRISLVNNSGIVRNGVHTYTILIIISINQLEFPLRRGKTMKNANSSTITDSKSAVRPKPAHKIKHAQNL